MENKKEKTAPDVSVGADTEQPISKKPTSSISENSGNIKSFEELQREMQLRSDPSYLQTISMNELFDTQYQSKQPLIDSLLYPGTYIFAGSPKLGKSFLMAQLAYHVSTGTPFWNYTTRKGTVLYLALRTITAACRNACTGCLEQKAPIILLLCFCQSAWKWTG